MITVQGVGTAIDNVKALLAGITSRRIIYLAAKETMIDVSERVWDRGELTGGGTLTYGDGELYAYTPPSPKKVTGNGKPFAEWKNQPRAKAIKKSQGGTARKIKGGFYHSYTEYKAQQSRADTPFELTGRLRKAYFGGTDTPEPKQDSDTEVTIRLRGEEAQKWEGLTASKGAFLALTAAEIQKHHAAVKRIYLEQ